MPSPDRSRREAADQGVAYLDAYGLAVDSEISLPGMAAAPPRSRGDRLALRRAPAGELPSLLDHPRYLRNLQSYDGAAYAMLESDAGDVLFAYGRDALFHLCADATLLRCAVAEEAEPRWQRVLLDTVLWTISLLRGFELLHASAVVGERGVIALVARTGGGKSSLAAEFLARGAALFADDVVALDDRGGELVAHPGPGLMNLPRAIGPEVLGRARVLAELGDERWVELDRGAVGAASLSAVVLVNRVAGERLRCVPERATSLTLLPYSLSLPHLGDRARRRFDVFGALAAQARVLSLHADTAVPPSELADAVEQQLESS